MSLNQSLVGKTFGPFAPFVVDAAVARAWRDAVSVDVSVDSVDSVDSAPPPPKMMAVAFAAPVVGAVMFDPLLNVDLMRLLHGEQDMRFVAPVVVGDTITTTGVIELMAETASGELLVIALTSKNQDGVVVVEARTSLNIRGSRQRDAHDRDRADRADEAAAFDALAVGFAADVVVGEDQARRYAAASGDHNPIHLEVDVARQAGLPGCILHGLCVMALVHDVVVDAVGDVGRLAVRFNRPVLIGDRLRIEGRTRDDGRLALRVRNQAGIDVLAAAVAERA